MSHTPFGVTILLQPFRQSTAQILHSIIFVVGCVSSEKSEIIFEVNKLFFARCKCNIFIERKTKWGLWNSPLTSFEVTLDLLQIASNPSCPAKDELWNRVSRFERVLNILFPSTTQIFIHSQFVTRNCTMHWDHVMLHSGIALRLTASNVVDDYKQWFSENLGKSMTCYFKKIYMWMI